jgi:hypothetical protein
LCETHQLRFALAQGIAERASGHGQTLLSDSWAKKAREFEVEAEAVRESMRRIDSVVGAVRGR